MVLCGCSDDIVPPDPLPGEGQPRDMFLCLHLTMSGGDMPGMAPDAMRADAAVPNPDQGLTPGTPMENTARTIALFVYDAVNDNLVDYVYLEGGQVAEVMSESGLLVPIYGTPGETIRIHAVVNPTQKIIDQFSGVDNILDITSVSDKTEYRDVINELVPGTGGHQTMLENNKTAGIPMTGEFREPGNTDNNVITLTSSMTEDNPLKVTAEATRIVAKLHVLASATQEYTLTGGIKMRYVYAEDKTADVRELDDAEFANWIGWIRLSNVRYIPNAMNKSTYLFPHTDETGKPIDLNMNMMDYAIGNRLYRLKYDKDFVYYYGEDLHNINISADGHMGQAEMFTTERWNATKGNTDNANRYTQGMYCLENYFTEPSADDNNRVFKTYTDNGFAIPIVTQITVAARLAPRNIVVAKSYATNMDNLVKEYKDNPSKFYNDYGLTPADFGDNDVTLWENTLRERYFGTPLETYRSEFYIIKALTEDDAAHLINWSLMANGLWSDDPADFNNGKYPSGTYYVYDTKYDTKKDVVWKQKYLYLTAGAVNLATDMNINIKLYSVPHISGWGYYFTYLDQSGTVSDKQIPYTKSQVTRNTYYLINIENFGSPGGTITHPEYIRVNTVPVNWTYGGRGDADLR